MQTIWSEPGDADAWHCLCGNEPCDDGFYPCDERCMEMEPLVGSAWAGLYVCARCARIIRQDTLEIAGQAKGFLVAEMTA